jgi:hypothetical protein
VHGKALEVINRLRIMVLSDRGVIDLDQGWSAFGRGSLAGFCRAAKSGPEIEAAAILLIEVKMLSAGMLQDTARFTPRMVTHGRDG